MTLLGLTRIISQDHLLEFFLCENRKTSRKTPKFYVRRAGRARQNLKARRTRRTHQQFWDVAHGGHAGHTRFFGRHHRTKIN